MQDLVKDAKSMMDEIKKMKKETKLKKKFFKKEAKKAWLPQLQIAHQFPGVGVRHSFSGPYYQEKAEEAAKAKRKRRESREQRSRGKIRQ